MTFDRKNAFSADYSSELPPHDTGIKAQLCVCGDLIHFTTDGIFRVNTADKIDPTNSAPDTRHSYEKLYNFGTRNPCVARTIIQADRCLNPALLPNGLDYQALLDHVWHASQLIFSCEATRIQIHDAICRLIPICDELVENEKGKVVIKALPQVENLDQHVVSFLNYAKRFIEYTHRLLGHFYNCPTSNENWREYFDWMVKHCESEERIIKMLESDQEWLQELSHRRNALDASHGRDGYKLEISNFRLQPGNKFNEPGWKYDFSAKVPDMRQEEMTSIRHDLDCIMDNILTFFEELLVLCIDGTCKRHFIVRLVEIKTEVRNLDCPQRFAIETYFNPKG